ncbi:hypothetical protein Tco_0032788 [Tanacetum coccineum]
MSKLLFCDYHNMVAILEKTEHNTDFQQIVDFLGASPLRIETADGETHIIAKINGEQVTVFESSLRRKLKLKDEERISDLPDTDLFKNLSQMGYNILPNQRFSFQKGANESASLLRDDSHGEAFPTATSLDVGQTRENIPKTSAMPHEPSPRVTSLDGGEVSMQQTLNELMAFCTTLQHQHTQMDAKIQSQDLEISQLKSRIKTLEDAQKNREGVQEDAPNRGGIMDQGEEFGIEIDSNKSTNKGSKSTGEMANVLSSMGAANILASGGLKEFVTTASPQFSPASLQVAPASATDAPTVATASTRIPTVVTSVTTRPTKTYTRRARVSRGVVIESSQPSQTTSAPTFSTIGKEKMTEPKKPRKKRVARDAEIARIQAEGDLRQMIDELDRSNEVVNKHMAEYEQAEQDLSLEEKINLIRVLLNYQKNLAQSHAGWKAKDFKGMTFDQIEEAFIPAWKSIQDFVPMDSKLESERVKRPGILLQQESLKRMKTVEASETEPS